MSSSHPTLGSSPYFAWSAAITSSKLCKASPISHFFVWWLNQPFFQILARFFHFYKVFILFQICSSVGRTPHGKSPPIARMGAAWARHSISSMLRTKPIDKAPRTKSRMPEVSIKSKVPSNKTCFSWGFNWGKPRKDGGLIWFHQVLIRIHGGSWRLNGTW